MPASSPSSAPSIRVVPRRVSRSDGPLAVQLASAYGLTPDDWQEDAVDCSLCRRKNGRYAAATVKITVPRQNGKNGILEVRELYGMVVLGEKFLHTAHEVKTARKAFRRIASFFENERQYPELAALVQEIRKTNGQEAIILKCPPCADKGPAHKCEHGWGSIEFIARSSGSGRGFTVDVLVCDEDQDLTDDELAALLPTISAAPLGNPQVILTGTPPDPEKQDAAKGEVARRVRLDAINGTDPNLFCVDYGVPDGPMPDVDDKAIWYRTNPALGTRLNVAEVERERKLMSPEKFARERLGWWGDPHTKNRGVISLKDWATCRIPDPGPPVRAQVVLDVAPDLTWSAIGLAASGPLDRVLVLEHHDAGTGWVVPKLLTVLENVMAIEVALTPTAQIFAADLTAADIEYEQLSNAEVGRGCTAFQEWVKGGKDATGQVRARIAHLGQIELDAAVQNAKTRFVGDTQHWDRRNRDIDLSPLVATSVAAQRWVMKTAKPDRPPPAPRRAHSRAAAGAASAGF